MSRTYQLSNREIEEVLRDVTELLLSGGVPNFPNRNATSTDPLPHLTTRPPPISHKVDDRLNRSPGFPVDTGFEMPRLFHSQPAGGYPIISLLTVACLLHRVDVVELLLNRGSTAAGPTLRLLWGPQHYRYPGSGVVHREIVELLLLHHGGLYAARAYNHVVLYTAIREKDLDTVKGGADGVPPRALTVVTVAAPPREWFDPGTVWPLEDAIFVAVAVARDERSGRSDSIRILEAVLRTGATVSMAFLEQQMRVVRDNQHRLSALVMRVTTSVYDELVEADQMRRERERKWRQ